jgi:hypothetical protein
MLSLNKTKDPIPQSTKLIISISIPISKPIPIPKSQSIDNIILEEYSLKCNNFNPSKMSPPDTWKVRLAQRLKEHCYTNNCSE